MMCNPPVSAHPATRNLVFGQKDFSLKLGAPFEGDKVKFETDRLALKKALYPLAERRDSGA
jgi:hypothetical protein